MLGDGRREQGIEHHAHVAGTGDSHNHALILWRIPAARLRQGDGEGRTADAEHQAEDHDRELAVEPELPHPGRRRGDDELRDDAGPLGADDIREDAHRNPQQGASQNWNGNERELLADSEIHVVRDVDDQRTERDPGHETDVKIQERGEQRRPMACFLKLSKLHCYSLRLG